MKTKKKVTALLSALCLVTAVTAVATAQGAAETALDANRFAIGGASIRLKTPYGLRFVVEMGETTLAQLDENNELGMLIVPKDYLTQTIVEEESYHTALTEKLDYTFTAENIYEGESGYYCANGVITNLYLTNYARDFAAIGYIATTDGESITYEYTEPVYRSASWVASAAYEDATLDANKSVLEDYVVGAYMNKAGYLMQTEDGKYSFNSSTFDSVTDVKKAIGYSGTALTLDKEKVTVYAGEESVKVTATAVAKTTAVGDFSLANPVPNIIWKSANEKVATVKDGVVEYVGAGSTTITASYMGASVDCTVTASPYCEEAVDWINNNHVSTYKVTSIDENQKVVLGAGTHNLPSQPTQRAELASEHYVSYIAFDTNYGLNDYVVVDFTGNNMPMFSFFNGEVMTTPFFNTVYEKDQNKGLILTNGWTTLEGKPFATWHKATSVHKAMQIHGAYKMYGTCANNKYANASYESELGTQQRQYLNFTEGKAGMYAMTDGFGEGYETQKYRMIVGFTEGTADSVTVAIYLVNLTSGKILVNGTETKTGMGFGSTDYFSGKIAMYGNFGKETVLDKVYAIEEDTTMTALIAKYSGEEEPSAEAPDYSAYSDLQFESYAYSALKDTETENMHTSERYQEYKEAGFTIYFAGGDTNIVDGFSEQNWLNDVKPIFDDAYAAGLKVLVRDQRLMYWSTRENSLFPTNFADAATFDSYVTQYMQYYKDHPAFYGVMLGDEPFASQVTAYGEVYKAIKRVAPTAHVQMNLLPLRATEDALSDGRYPTVEGTFATLEEQAFARYEAYLQSFIDATGAEYIQYDDYPIYNGYLSTTYIRGLQIAANVAKRNNVELYMVSQTFAMDKNGTPHWTKVDEADAVWMNNMLLGHGAKQLQYFTYTTRTDNEQEDFIDGASYLTEDGKRTDLYYFMRKIMHNNNKFAPTILNFDYQGSRSYVNSATYENDYIANVENSYEFKKISNVTVDKETGYVSELYDSENGHYMYMVMNATNPWDQVEQTTTVTFSSEYTHVLVYVNGVATVQELGEGNTLSVTLNSGEAVFLLPY